MARQTDAQAPLPAPALPLMAIYQCIKFHLIPFYTFRDMLQTSFLLQKLRREVTPSIMVTGLWFLHSAISFMALYQCIKFHLFILNTSRDMLRTSLLLHKLEITFDRVMVLALCTSINVSSSI